jgi:hypothetical protein
MAIAPQFGKSTTLASTMAAGASSATLSSAAFTNSSNDYLVLDYDVPAKREVIKCSVTGTAVSSVTRAQDGTSDVEHSAGAKVAYIFVPSQFEGNAKNIGARVYLSADQDNIENATWTKITLDTEDYDLGADFGSNKFTVPLDGKYLVSGKVFVEGTDLLADKALAVGVYKNGTIARQFQDSSVVTGSGKSIQFATIMDLSASDYLELYFYHGNGNNNIDIESGDTMTYLEVQFLHS